MQELKQALQLGLKDVWPFLSLYCSYVYYIHFRAYSQFSLKNIFICQMVLQSRFNRNSWKTFCSRKIKMQHLKQALKFLDQLVSEDALSFLWLHWSQIHFYLCNGFIYLLWAGRYEWDWNFDLFCPFKMKGTGFSKYTIFFNLIPFR